MPLSTLHNSSIKITKSKTFPPKPLYSFGTRTLNKPVSAITFTISQGKISSSSYLSLKGFIFSCATFRANAFISFCSSVRKYSIAPPIFLLMKLSVLMNYIQTALINIKKILDNVLSF